MTRADELASRCDFENALYLQGDLRGIYGVGFKQAEAQVVPILPSPDGPPCYRCKARGETVPATKSWGEDAEVCESCSDHLETLR